MGSSSSSTSGRLSSCAARPSETIWPPLRVLSQRSSADVGEAEPVELGAGAFLDVPVGADGGEVLFADVTGLDGGDRVQDRGDAEDFGDGQFAAQRQVLREVTEQTVDGDAARGRLQLSGDELEQGRLAGAVRARRDRCGRRGRWRRGGRRRGCRRARRRTGRTGRRSFRARVKTSGWCGGKGGRQRRPRRDAPGACTLRSYPEMSTSPATTALLCRKDLPFDDNTYPVDGALLRSTTQKRLPSGSASTTKSGSAG